MFLRHLGGSPLLVTSASDLNAAGDCEFAFLRRVDEKLGRQLRVPRSGDPMLARAAELGDAHEARVLQHYRDRFGAAEVLEIRRPESMDPMALSARADESRAALAAGTRVIAQATFFDPLARPAAPELGEPGIAMLGFADFLVRDERGRYEVHDAKLARRARVGALLQLASYAEQLERLGVPRAEEAALILGDGSTSRHRLDEVAPVLGARRARLWQILLDRARARGTDGRRESAAPVAWGTSGVVACGRCEVCEPEVVRTRDPLLIAGLRRSQRDRLRAAGLSTIDAVAALVDGAGESRADASARAEVPGIAPTVLRGIAEQAAVQVRAVPGRPVPFTVVDPSALLALPAPDPGDLFFDFEGDPFFHEARPDGREQWGLDYLFGMCDTHERFTALWAHSLAEERDALERFLALVAERRRRFPGLRIYHYAAYERTHLLQIAARHGTGEEAVDQLLREHVLVDLYPIVARAVRVGSRSRSLKQLESLTVPGVPSLDGDAALLDPLRDDARVTTAVQSVTAYAEASALRASGDPAQRAEAERRLAEIADYNRADCVSTLRLREWLRSLTPASSAPVAPDADPVPPVPRVGAPTAASGAPGTVLARSLAALADRRQVPAERRALALAGSAIEYHRREQKAFWWAQFSRLVDPVEEWAGTRDVLIVDAPRSAIVQPWSLAPRARREQRRVRLVGQFAPGSSVRAGSRVFLLYAAPPPFADPGAAPGARAARQATVLERHADGVTVEEALPVGGERFERLPMAVAPGPPPPAGSQREAIEEWGSELLRACERDTFPESAVLDLLLRRPPRLRGGAALRAGSAPAPAPGSDDDGGEIEAVLAGVRLLDRSTLAVQGPPGTGKTFLAAQVIRRLVVEDGWRVGVVAQSHRVVEHLLDGVVAAGLDPARVGKAVQSSAGGGASPSWRYTVIPRGGHAAFLRGDDDGATRGCVLGGTAWDFSNPSRVARGSLDLLVIDEAGQFSLAPTIAASVAAERLLLLGDPQQLPQVSQGLHAEPVDRSALAWLLGERQTLPEDLGFFLSRTRRMRPELADVVSELSYDGRLDAHPGAALREVLGAGPPGLHWHPVTHTGNSTSSPEEAEVVTRLARAALRGELREPGRDPRSLSPADVIVVAAFNAQVECVSDALAAAGLGEIRVGTVDRFQGQEAVVAIVTLAASGAAEVPRGIEFLLLRNRLNVAVSRAQWSAHLVSSVRLGDGLPRTADALTALSGYLRLTERGRGPRERAPEAWRPVARSPERPIPATVEPCHAPEVR